MKTIVKNLFTLSAAILLTMSVMAQNTKSVHYAVYTVEDNHKVTARVDKLIQKLSTELESLKAYAKYIPAAHMEDLRMESMDEMSIIQESLKADARFVPNQNVEELVENTDNMEMDSILKELEKDARYRPADENMEMLQEAVAELSVYARYQPSTEF